MDLSLFSERLEKAMDDKGWTNYKLSKETGVAQSTIGRWLKGKSEPQTAQVLLIAENLGVTKEYLLSGESISVVSETASKYPSLSNKGVPYYDVDFYGGFDFAFNDQTIQPSYVIDYAPYNDCDAWINVTGKSMSPFISHGDIAALKKLEKWNDFIPFGEIYAVLTEEHKTIKIVSKGKDDNHFKLIPYNNSGEFVEQDIPKDLIQQMYRVKGSIKKFF